MSKFDQRQKFDLFEDAVFITASLAVSVWLVKSNVLDGLIAATQDIKFLGSFVAGTLFTSAFTTAPAIAVLGKIAHSGSVLSTALIGGAGALFGDFFIFRFVRDRLSEDLGALFKKTTREKFRHIVHKKLFRWFSPLLASFIIASPLPDELGLALLGVMHTRTLLFVPFSFISNFAGIFVISGIAKLVA